jgi:hypothetical protein
MLTSITDAYCFQQCSQRGCNGALAPPSKNCYALDIMEFLPFIYKNLTFAELLKGKNTKLQPQIKLLNTPLINDV